MTLPEITPKKTCSLYDYLYILPPNDKSIAVVQLIDWNELDLEQQVEFIMDLQLHINGCGYMVNVYEHIIEYAQKEFNHEVPIEYWNEEWWDVLESYFSTHPKVFIDLELKPVCVPDELPVGCSYLLVDDVVSSYKRYLDI